MHSERISALVIAPQNSHLSKYLSSPFYDIKIGEAKDFVFDIESNSALNP